MPPKLDEAGEKGERGGQPELVGREELARRIDAVAAEPAEQFLRAVRHEQEAGNDAKQGIRERRKRFRDRGEGGNDRLGG